MIRINLLPHREIKRRARQKLFMAMTMSAVILGVVIVLIGHLILKQRLENQNNRIKFLNTEIAGLDVKIEQIKKIKQEIEALTARKNEVEKLQESRTETVHMLDEVARGMPDGVYLKAIKQTGKKVLFEGFAQSNARISTLMENLDRSPWFDSPELLESKQVTLNAQRIYEFSLDIHLNHDAAQDIQKKDAAALVSVPSATEGAASVGGNAKGVGHRSGTSVQPVAMPAVQTGIPGKTVSAPPFPVTNGIGKPSTPVSPLPMPVPVVNPKPLAHPAAAPLPSSTGIQPSVSTPGAVPNAAGKHPVLLGGLPTPQSVAEKVSGSLSAGQKRSMP
jgi:type IV pilus assembly protein PilN